MLCEDTIHAANRPETEGSPRNRPSVSRAVPPQRAMRHTRGLPDRSFPSSPRRVLVHEAWPLLAGGRLDWELSIRNDGGRSPRLRVVPRRHHEVRAVAAAVGTAEPQLRQQHVTPRHSDRAGLRRAVPQPTRHPYILQPRIVRHMEKIVLGHLTPHYHHNQGE